MSSLSKSTPPIPWFFSYIFHSPTWVSLTTSPAVIDPPQVQKDHWHGARPSPRNSMGRCPPGSGFGCPQKRVFVLCVPRWKEEYLPNIGMFKNFMIYEYDGMYIHKDILVFDGYDTNYSIWKKLATAWAITQPGLTIQPKKDITQLYPSYTNMTRAIAHVQYVHRLLYWMFHLP